MWITFVRLKKGVVDQTLSRSTVELGYKKAREMGVVKGTESIGLARCGIVSLAGVDPARGVHG